METPDCSVSRRLFIGLVALVHVAAPILALGAERLRMATTTSTENSGLLARLNPAFEEKNQVRVDVIAVGTGKALKLAENGDVDLVLVHAPDAEKRFVAAGFGVDRRAVMHNDFVLLGPGKDPAAVRAAPSVTAAFSRIENAKATFVSRGDDSGTHKKEMIIWLAVGIEPSGAWYLSTGQGMSAVLRIADEKMGYTLSDRGTFLAYKAKLDLSVLYQGDPILRNPYHIIAVNPKRHGHVNYGLAKQYIDFVTSREGQCIIADFKINGQQLFYPDVIGSP